MKKKISMDTAARGKTAGKRLIGTRPGVMRAVYDLVWIYLDRGISRAAAALSYYMIFTLFPMFIIIHAVLAGLNLRPDALLTQLELFLPQQVAEFFSYYISYINQNNSSALLVMGIALLVTTASAAFRIIMRSNDEIFRTKTLSGGVSFLISLLMPPVLVVVFYLSLVIILTGSWFFRMLEQNLNISVHIDGWDWMRFLILFGMLLLFMIMVYAINRPRTNPRPPILPGALGASIALVVVSLIFSSVMGANSKYSAVYGSVAALIIMMLWLWLMANIMLMGNAANYLIYRYQSALRTNTPLDHL